MPHEKPPPNRRSDYVGGVATANGRQPAARRRWSGLRCIALGVFVAVLSIPWLVLTLFALRYRDQTLSATLAGGRGAVALLVLVAGVAGTLWGRDAWSVIDASWFAERSLAGVLRRPLATAASSRSPGQNGRASARARNPQAREAGSNQAYECLGCGRVFAPTQHHCPVCDQPLRRAPVPYVLLKKLRFDERIGIGGMAVVYRATDLSLGRSVAVKTLPRMSAAAAARLRREARAAAAIIHPGLASIFSVETWQGMPLLVQELLDGTLAERIVGGPLAAREVIETGIVVAQALDALHIAGILHRDIKPSNIGFGRDGTAKLLDFGIARVTSDLRRDAHLRHPSTQELIALGADTTLSWSTEPSSSSQADQLVGTLSYLPPEALENASATASFDLWALAVVLYEALSGTNLFYGGSPDQLVQRILTADIPDIKRRVPTCPEPLAAFFRWGLERDPARRPKTGTLFAEGLIEVRRSLTYATDKLEPPRE